MATGPMQFGADNNAGPNQPNHTILRAQNSNQTTLEVRNEIAGGRTAGGGLSAEGGPFAVKGVGGGGSDSPGIGVHGVGVGDRDTGVLGEGQFGVRGTSDTATAVWAVSQQWTGVLGDSSSHDQPGAFGVNDAGGYGVAGITFGLLNSDRAAVGGWSLPDPSTPQAPGGPNGKAAGVFGYSETGYGGVFITGQAGSNVPWVNSGGLRVIGEIVKTEGEYSEALPHPDGSQRLLYAPLCPESWYEDYGRARLVDGSAEVELDADFAAVLGIEADEYHVFLTPEGETRGLYVDSRNDRSFIVREQQGGTSSTTFSYRVAAKNTNRQPKRLPVLEESEELTTMLRQTPSRLPSRVTNDHPDTLA
jgi:hypothetical protein